MECTPLVITLDKGDVKVSLGIGEAAIGEASDQRVAWAGAKL